MQAPYPDTLKGVNVSLSGMWRGVKSNDVLNIRSQATARSRINGVIPPTACDVEVYSYANSVNGFVRVKYRSVIDWTSLKFLYVL